MSLPEPAAGVLDDLVAGLRDLLGANLVGAYAYGSLAWGCYNPARSDVDVLVATRRPLAPETRGPLSSLLRVLARRTELEITFLSSAELRPWRYPCPYDFHFSGSAERHRGAGKDFAAEFVNARTRAIVLAGPPAQDVFPPVPDEDYVDCILSDIEWARERLEKRPTYAVLNMCRVLAYTRERALVSKAAGGEWALRMAPPPQRAVVERALANYRGPTATDSGFETASLTAFCDWFDREIAASYAST